MTESSVSELRRAPLPDAYGRPAVVQGRYGDSGNLELVFADPDDGLWVCWFNSDDRAAEPLEQGALPGEWSGGLHFAGGRAYQDVALIQAHRGPDFLELVATSGTRLEHWTWTPRSGFEHRGELPMMSAVSVPTIRETDTGLVVGAVDSLCIRRWTADASTYPRPRWRTEIAQRFPGGTATSAAYVGRDGRTAAVAAVGGRLLMAPRRPGDPWTDFADLGEAAVRGLALVEAPHGGPLAVAATDTGVLTVDGGRVSRIAAAGCSAVGAAWSVTDAERLEVVGRDGDRLVHVRARVGRSGEILDESTRTVESTVRWPADAPVHRRS